MQTFRLHDEVKEWLYDPAVVGTAFDLVRPHVATLALFNKTGSGKVVRVRQVKAEVLQGQTTVTAAPTNFGIQFITAHTPGDEIIPSIKVDSSNAALPSQVVMARRPPAITTSGSVMETVPLIPLANVTRALAGLASRAMHSNLNDNIWRWEHGSDVQKITLNEGEGIALDPAGIHNAYPHWLEAGVNVRVVATGACYRYKFPCYTSPYPLYSLLNGAGSGVVLEVFRITLREIGTDEAPQVTVERIDGIHEAAGYASTPKPFDSANSLDANIIGRGNVPVMLAGAKGGGITGAPHLFATHGLRLGVGPGLAGFAPQMQGNFLTSQRHLGRNPHDEAWDITLREGEGLALFQRTASGLTYFDLSFQFTAQDAVDPGAAVFPAEGDVRDGVTYGPTGADNEGDLVLPTEAQVQSGVGFGADGTEFTGTLSGGGDSGGRVFRM